MINKTKTITTTAAATTVALTTALLLSLPKGDRYDTLKNAVDTTLADNCTAVLIYHDDGDGVVSDDDIVYIDENLNTYEAEETFLLKNGIESGKYVMLLKDGDTGEVNSQTFYIDEDGTVVSGQW